MDTDDIRINHLRVSILPILFLLFEKKFKEKVVELVGSKIVTPILNFLFIASVIRLQAASTRHIGKK